MLEEKEMKVRKRKKIGHRGKGKGYNCISNGVKRI